MTFGPAYLVVADVPLPFAIPYGFFPFTKSYSSGFIMPSYGDESSRGFYLRDGGYYFALSDKMDLKLIGEIYTKGSWGLTATSNYNKRYKYSGTFLVSYQDTRTGDKGMPDYAKQTSFKVQWSHRQDSKANPFSSLSASVNFATSSYERNNLTSMYNPQSLTQSTRTSSVNWSTTFSSIGMTLSSTANLSQNMRDSTIAMTLPDLNISISRFYPFRRKHQVGDERWYEKISMSYTGQFSNSISTKENQLLHSNLIKDWRNGFQHSIPISANFTLFNYINLTPSFNFTDRMYTNKVTKSWDQATQTEVSDTTYGFHNVYNWNLAVSASTKLYGFWVPNRKIFGDKIQAIRHVITPTVSFSYAPDFGASRYGYYQTYQKTDADGNVSLVQYSPYSDALYGVPGKGRTGSISWSFDNNIEMKVKSDKDSTGFKKISIIDQLGWSMSYNMAAKEKPLSNLTVNLRLKWWKNYTFNMTGVFASYAYEVDSNGTPYVGNHTYWGMGKFGRFQGMSQNISYTLTPDKINDRSPKNVWWRCRACGYEWRAVVKARVKGLKCPVCADRAVLGGYNDLATTDKALLKEWPYELNTDVEPTKITRNSLRPVWWRCKYGHTWKEKIAKRTIEGERCPVCEEEFARVLPQLLIMLYCGRLGFKVRLNDEETIGITLDAYIPELKLAVAVIGNGTKAEEEAVLVTQHLCKVRGLLFDTVSFKDSAEGVCRGVKKAFQGAHIYITSDNDDDVRTAHRQFFRWKKC